MVRLPFENLLMNGHQDYSRLQRVARLCSEDRTGETANRHCAGAACGGKRKIALTWVNEVLTGVNGCCPTSTGVLTGQRDEVDDVGKKSGPCERRLLKVARIGNRDYIAAAWAEWLEQLLDVPRIGAFLNTRPPNFEDKRRAGVGLFASAVAGCLAARHAAEQSGIAASSEGSTLAAGLDQPRPDGH
jgi:hypothetical protein